MDFSACERFLSQCHIKNRDAPGNVKFVFNRNQSIIHQKAKEQYDAGRPIRVIVNKARRVGVSSWAEGLLFCHCLALPGSHALIAAHEYKSSKALFRVPLGLAESTPFLHIDDVEREMRFPHPSSPSLLQIVTAGKETSGRGFTLSALHLSEGAHYKSPEPYQSIIPAVGKYRATIIVIESTPNGIEGDGEPFYNMWLDAISGHGEYEAVFLSWTEDPACIAPEEFAKDAPADEEEKELLARGLTKSQLAWRRITIKGPECRGLVENFHQEFPVTWEESFISSGMPAFADDEKRWCHKNIRKPKLTGFLERTTDGSFRFRPHTQGDLRIWEDPIPGHYYYIGVDAARGEEGRDFSAAVGIDGTTGHQVFTYAGYAMPEVLAAYSNSLGRRYNKAMVNPEITGGYGYTVMAALRDVFLYPNQYLWKGKDDKMVGGARKSTFGWETTGHTRTILFETLRVCLREASGTDGDYGVTLYDDQLVSQIDRCTRKDFRVDVEKGHDDILFACMLANIAMRHWAPPRAPNRARNDEQEGEQRVMDVIKSRGDVVLSDAKDMLHDHYEKVQREIKRGARREAVYEEV